jgi:hypothetical protein
MTTERSRHLAAHPARLPTGDPRSHPASLDRPRGRPNHCPSSSHDDGQVQADASAGPAQPAPASTLGSDSSDDEPVVNTAGDHADPTIPAMRLPAPPRPYSGRTDRTRERSDTGRPHWTPDVGHLDAQTPAPDTDTGRVDRHAWTWTLDAAPDTGRRTLADDADAVTKARPAFALLGHNAQRPRWATKPYSSDSACGRSATMTARR